MTTFKFLGAVAILSALASPASAQHMIEEPGMYAFVHPNGDVLGVGTPRQPSEAMAMAPRMTMRHQQPMRHIKPRR